MRGKVKTHLQMPHNRMPQDDKEAVCFKCGLTGWYWSQWEDARGGDYPPISRDVQHCQRHRNEARAAVVTPWYRKWAG